MQRQFNKYMWSLIVGAVLFTICHFVLQLNWSREASLDIVCGAIVEFFIFQVLLEIIANRQQKHLEERLSNQLEEIKKLIKGGANEF